MKASYFYLWFYCFIVSIGLHSYYFPFLSKIRRGWEKELAYSINSLSCSIPLANSSWSAVILFFNFSFVEESSKICSNELSDNEFTLPWISFHNSFCLTISKKYVSRTLEPRRSCRISTEHSWWFWFGWRWIILWQVESLQTWYLPHHYDPMAYSCPHT